MYRKVGIVGAETTLQRIHKPVPEISRFFGIIITMNYNDHATPHFHARYGGDQAIVEIHTLQVLAGRLSPRVMGMITEWAGQHREELLENWRLARERATEQDRAARVA